MTSLLILRTWTSTGIDRAGKALTVTTTFDDDIEFINTGSGWIADSDGNMACTFVKVVSLL